MVAGLVGVGALFALLVTERTSAPLVIGSSAPPLDFAALAGQPGFSPKAVRGRVLLLHFWATWCAPCEAEMPALERLSHTLRHPDFVLAAVSVDQDPQAVQTFRERLRLTLFTPLDPEQSGARAYQTFRFPETFLIDRQGVIRARFIGPREWDVPFYQQQIQRLIEEKSASGSPQIP